MSENNNNNPFNILGGQSTPVQTGQAVESTPQAGDINQKIKSLINSADVFLFMKGQPMMPQCGFSANVVGILNHLNTPFKSFDILSDTEIRQGVKEFSNWPTYPQLYVKGELLGGNDIIMELFESGELKSMLPTNAV